MSNEKAGPRTFSISFDPTIALKEAETQMKKQFENTLRGEINQFCGSRATYNGNKLVTVEGAGLLLIREFLEKKFDDPKTQEWMEKFYEENFPRIMGEAMEKALQHKANAFAFHMQKQVQIAPAK